MPELPLDRTLFHRFLVHESIRHYAVFLQYVPIGLEQRLCRNSSLHSQIGKCFLRDSEANSLGKQTILQLRQGGANHRSRFGRAQQLKGRSGSSFARCSGWSVCQLGMPRDASRNVQTFPQTRRRGRGGDRLSCLTLPCKWIHQLLLAISFTFMILLPDCGR